MLALESFLYEVAAFSTWFLPDIYEFHIYSGNSTNCFYFLQAEDGIRVLVQSRGLGDVYKRQGRGPEQVTWLTAELGGKDSRAAAFRIVAFHKAPYSNRWDSAGSKYDGAKWVRDQLVPVFAKGNVDLVIAGPVSYTHLTLTTRDLG